MISGPWFLRYLKLRGASEKYLSNLGAALPPGPPFVGGSNLVIWKQEGKERSSDAIDWVRHLTSADTQMQVCSATGLLPAVKGVLPSTVPDVFQPVFAAALEKGNPLPQAAFWGTIEAELVRVFGNIWSDLKEDPRYTARSVVLSHLEPLAKILDDKLYRHSILPHPPA
jgi:ABC-type glycerol-3-phosphate transport system substrate-binding protein